MLSKLFIAVIFVVLVSFVVEVLLALVDGWIDRIGSKKLLLLLLFLNGDCGGIGLILELSTNVVVICFKESHISFSKYEKVIL